MKSLLTKQQIEVLKFNGFDEKIESLNIYYNKEKDMKVEVEYEDDLEDDILFRSVDNKYGEIKEVINDFDYFVRECLTTIDDSITKHKNNNVEEKDEEVWIDPAGEVHCGSYFSEV